jgi:Uncharacterized protein conserved in bacteria (DUF2188)
MPGGPASRLLQSGQKGEILVVAKQSKKATDTIRESVISPSSFSGKRTKTVYIVHRGDGWAVQRGGDGSFQIHATQQAAIDGARKEIRSSGAGQMVVFGLDGKIRDRSTYKLPPIQDPPGKRSARIEKAVSKVTRDRLAADLLPPRG